MLPIKPKAPKGFKDYLLNRRTYTLSGNSSAPMGQHSNADPPEGLPDVMKKLFDEQETERHSLRMQVSFVRVRNHSKGLVT